MNHNDYRIIFYFFCLTCLGLGASKHIEPGGATAAEPGGKCGKRLSLL